MVDLTSSTDVPEGEPTAAEVIPHPILEDAKGKETGQTHEVPEPADGSETCPRARGYYEKVEFREEPVPRLEFTRVKGSSSPPTAMREFRRQISEVAQVIRLVFHKERGRRTSFFQELRVIAESGAVGGDYSIDVGLDGLEELKARMTYEFPHVRGHVWKWNFIITVFTVLLCLTASALSYKYMGSWIPGYGQAVSPAISLLFAAALIPLGVAFGLFAEFVFRVGDSVTYSQLAEINPGRWKPVQRAVNTLIIAAIFAAILAKGVFHVGVASTVLNDFWINDPMLSVAVGFVTGFAYPFVRDIVQQFRPERRGMGEGQRSIS